MSKNIHFIFTGFLSIFFIVVATGCATSPQQNKVSTPRIERISEAELARIAPHPLEILTLDEIVNLSKSGASPEQIIEKIKKTDSLYELTPSQSITLSQQGVDNKVLDYIHSSRELAWRNSVADEINKREKDKRVELEKLKRQQLQQQRFYDPFCRGYYGLSPYGVYGPRFGRPFGIRAGYVSPWHCW